MNRVGSSFKGMLAGLICFLLAWPVLYFGATRVRWARVFKKAVPVEQMQEGKPVYITGTAKSAQIGNTHLAKGDYLRINKHPEAYAYVEHRKSSTDGTADAKNDEYTYELQWTSNPRPVSEFNQAFWNQFLRTNRLSSFTRNPALIEKAEIINTPSCSISGYEVSAADISFFGAKTDTRVVYLRGREGTQRLGDIRVTYTLYPAGIEYTMAGSLSGKKLVPFYTKDTAGKLAASPGDFSALMAALKTSDKIAGIIWFLGGFFLMAMGLMLLAGPITTLLEFIPVIGSIGSGIIRVFLAIVAFILSFVFWWLISLWWLWLIIVAGTAGFLIVRKRMAEA